jgi:uncharacterized repeat protein (TIGR02543 family)
MNKYLRNIKVPKIHAIAVEAKLNEVFRRDVFRKDTLIGGDPYTIFEVISQAPILVKAANPTSLQRNASVTTGISKVRSVVYASDLDAGGVLSFDTSDVDNTTTDTYDVVITLVDKDAVETTLTVEWNVVDTLVPVITAPGTVTLAIDEIDAWDNDGVSAVDNTTDNLTTSIVTTYFEEDGTSSIADLAAFLTYLKNSYECGRSGVVRYNVADTDGNDAAEVVTIVSSTNDEYTLSFDVDGGVAMASVDYWYTEPLVEPSDPTKVGYTFDDWYAEAEQTTPFDFTGTMPEEDVTAYAKFVIIDYTVTYSLDGGANDPANPATYTVATATITLEDATRDLHTFGGWYDNAEFTGDAVTEISLGSTGDITLYAKFTPT